MILDLRSATNQATGLPTGLGDRTAWLRIDHGPPGHRIGEVISKRLRGAAAHELLESGVDPADPPELAAVLGNRWPVRLDPPERTGRPWRVTISPEI